MTMTSMTIPEAMTELRARGIAKVVVHFSGGNDEGGADSYIATAADGSPVELPRAVAYEGWQTKDREWVVTVWGAPGERATTRPATPEEVAAARIQEVLDAPIYQEYGSFAGEFSVDGTVTWDVAAGTFEMHGSYGSYDYTEF